MECVIHQEQLSFSWVLMCTDRTLSHLIGLLVGGEPGWDGVVWTTGCAPLVGTRLQGQVLSCSLTEETSMEGHSPPFFLRVIFQTPVVHLNKTTTVIRVRPLH